MEKYGDMRVLMGFQILSMWSNLRKFIDELCDMKYWNI